MGKNKHSHIQALQHRIRKQVRLSRAFERGDRIFTESSLCRKLVKDIIKGLPVVYVTKREQATKIVVPWTLDDENNAFLERMFSQKKKSHAQDSRLVKLLKPVSDKDAGLLAKAMRCSFSQRKKDPILMKMVENLAKDHPEVKQGLARSAEKLQGLLDDIPVSQ